MYYPKLVLVDEDDDMLPVPDNQDPNMTIQTMAVSNINKENADITEEDLEPDITSKEENEDK
eukprot:15352826-Ditylum_brightwellii.AAC.1